MLSVAFSPDGKYIVSGGWDRTLKLWDLTPLLFEHYIAGDNTELISSTGKVLTKLPIGTEIKIEEFKGDYLYIKVSETLKGWVKREAVSIEKPDLMRPVVRILDKKFHDPRLYLKGVAYDDKKIVSVEFAGNVLKRVEFEVDRGNYADVYPFESEITLTPGIELVLQAKDKSGKITTIPINIEEPVVDYVPKYVHLEVKQKAPVREKPDTTAEVLTTVSEKTVLVAIGNKSGWYYLEGGGWIHSSVVKEKAGIEEGELARPYVVELKAEKEEIKRPRILKEPVDVDVDIPLGVANPEAIGVIICVRDYEHKDVPAVEYAINDGETMKEYFIKLFEIKEENIIFVKNAKKSDFERLFGTEKDYKGQVYNWVKPGVSDLYIYYARSRCTGCTYKRSVFLPSDSHPNYVRLNGYPMNLLYRNVSKIPSKSNTLIIDACFSGASEKGMLIARASGIVIVPKEEFKGRRFTASSGDQIASWYPEKNHSLFTYFFLKGLKGEADKNKDKKVTIGEISNYVKENVSYQARRMYNREQTPEFQGDLNEILIRYRGH